MFLFFIINEDVAINTPDQQRDLEDEVELILGNSNPRFSGVTSTMLQTLRYQQELMNIRVLGAHHLPDPSLGIGFWQLVRLARTPRLDGKPRVFHARRNDEMIQALVLKYLFRCPLKIVFTSTAQRHHSGFTRWLMDKMDAVISTCEAAASYLKTPPAAIIPHGIDAEQYQPAEDRLGVMQSLQLPGQLTIGIFGRVREQKGVQHFVQACMELLPQYPDVNAVIVGAVAPSEASFVEELKAKIQAAGLSERVRITGELPFTDIPAYFQACSVVAALSRTEGFGLTVLEAMSSGAVVVATDAGAWKEVVREGIDGYVVPVGDQAAITDRLSHLLENPAKAQQMGKNGRQRILDDFTIQGEAQRLCDFYRTLQ